MQPSRDRMRRAERSGVGRKAALRAVALGLAALALALATYPLWKPVAKRWKWFVVATYVYQDSIRRMQISTDQIGHPYTTAPDVSLVSGYLDRIDDLFNGYVSQMGWSPSDLRGKTVLEVGPGDNVGVALRFVAAGASHVIALDKFVPFQTSAFHQALYRALRDRLGPKERSAFDEAVDLTHGVVLKNGPLQYVHGSSIEDAARLFGPNSVDVIVSNAVMEEVYDADGAWEALDRVWRPGGYQIHKIDLRDYGMFTNHGFHPLEFLTVPDGVYRYMSESVGAPNRRLVDYYRSKMARFGYDAAIYTTWILGEDAELIPPQLSLALDVQRSKAAALVQEIRPRLLERYRRLSDEELSVQGILLVAHRPAVVVANTPHDTRQATGQR